MGSRFLVDFLVQFFLSRFGFGGLKFLLTLFELRLIDCGFFWLMTSLSVELFLDWRQVQFDAHVLGEILQRTGNIVE